MQYNYVAEAMCVHAFVTQPKLLYFGITDEEYRNSYYIVGDYALVALDGYHYELYDIFEIVEIKPQSEVKTTAIKGLVCRVDYEHCVEK